MPGVLQRFAICYFVVAVTGVFAARIHGDDDDSEKVMYNRVTLVDAYLGCVNLDLMFYCLPDSA